MTYQSRKGGEIRQHETLEAALRVTGGFDKVSLPAGDGVRVILRSDGTWEVWTVLGRFTNTGFMAWRKGE